VHMCDSASVICIDLDCWVVDIMVVMKM